MGFQEILHGQEHYCSLAESRKLFNSLADPVEGCITRDTFKSGLEMIAVEERVVAGNRSGVGGESMLEGFYDDDEGSQLVYFLVS